MAQKRQTAVWRGAMGCAILVALCLSLLAPRLRRRQLLLRRHTPHDATAFLARRQSSHCVHILEHSYHRLKQTPSAHSPARLWRNLCGRELSFRSGRPHSDVCGRGVSQPLAPQLRLEEAQLELRTQHAAFPSGARHGEAQERSTMMFCMHAALEGSEKPSGAERKGEARRGGERRRAGRRDKKSKAEHSSAEEKRRERNRAQHKRGAADDKHTSIASRSERAVSSSSCNPSLSPPPPHADTDSLSLSCSRSLSLSPSLSRSLPRSASLSSSAPSLTPCASTSRTLSSASLLPLSAAWYPHHAVSVPGSAYSVLKCPGPAYAMSVPVCLVTAYAASVRVGRPAAGPPSLSSPPLRSPVARPQVSTGHPVASA
eukprot:3897229-Rhodomonas_salina.1